MAYNSYCRKHRRRWWWVNSISHHSMGVLQMLQRSTSDEQHSIRSEKIPTKPYRWTDRWCSVQIGRVVQSIHGRYEMARARSLFAILWWSIIESDRFRIWSSRYIQDRRRVLNDDGSNGSDKELCIDSFTLHHLSEEQEHYPAVMELGTTSVRRQMVHANEWIPCRK